MTSQPILSSFIVSGAILAFPRHLAFCRTPICQTLLRTPPRTVQASTAPRSKDLAPEGSLITAIGSTLRPALPSGTTALADQPFYQVQTWQQTSTTTKVVARTFNSKYLGLTFEEVT